MNSRDAFAPVASAPGSRPAESPQWRAIMPVPGDAPAPPAAHPEHGQPARRWEYRDAAKRLLGFVDRYEAKGEKEIRSLIYASHERFGRQWRFKGFPRPRPLYRADRLAARPAASVIVVEGEKSADAAAELFPDHVPITSPGGNNAAKLADWGHSPAET